MRFVSFLVVLVVVMACDATAPVPMGRLDSKIVSGQRLVYTAGLSKATEPTLGLVFRAAEEASASTEVIAQPNAVYCVGEDQHDLVPFSRCVTTDDKGNSRIDWINLPTRAGTYCGHLNATMGLEATTFDTACVTIKAGDVVDSLMVSDVGFRADDRMNSPAVFRPMSIQDKYGNGIPYRIVADVDLTPTDTTLGSEGARTVTFDKVDSTWRFTLIVGEQDKPVAQLKYRIVDSNSGPKLQPVLCGVAVLRENCNGTIWK
jgi:hypothetical protein